MKSTNNPSPSPVAILWPPPLCVAWLRPAPPGCSAPPQRRGSETRSRCRTKGRNLKKNHGVLVKMLEFIAIYPIFLVKMGLFYHDLSGRFDPIFLAMSRGFCSEFTSQNLGFFRIYGWFAAPFLDDFQFFRLFFYIFKHHRWIFPSIFPKIKRLGLNLHPQHLLHRLLIEAALKDAPPLWLLRAWEDLQRPSLENPTRPIVIKIIDGMI